MSRLLQLLLLLSGGAWMAIAQRALLGMEVATSCRAGVAWDDCVRQVVHGSSWKPQLSGKQLRWSSSSTVAAVSGEAATVASTAADLQADGTATAVVKGTMCKQGLEVQFDVQFAGTWSVEGEAFLRLDLATACRVDPAVLGDVCASGWSPAGVYQLATAAQPAAEILLAGQPAQLRPLRTPLEVAPLEAACDTFCFAVVPSSSPPLVTVVDSASGSTFTIGPGAVAAAGGAGGVASSVGGDGSAVVALGDGGDNAAAQALTDSILASFGLAAPAMQKTPPEPAASGAMLGVALRPDCAAGGVSTVSGGPARGQVAVVQRDGSAVLMDGAGNVQWASEYFNPQGLSADQLDDGQLQGKWLRADGGLSPDLLSAAPVDSETELTLGLCESGSFQMKESVSSTGGGVTAARVRAGRWLFNAPDLLVLDVSQCAGSLPCSTGALQWVARQLRPGFWQLSDGQQSREFAITGSFQGGCWLF